MVLMESAAQLTDKQFCDIRDLVKDRCGINLGEGKKQLVKARLAKHLRKHNMDSYDQYIELVRKDPTGNELITMLDAISTNLTSFFREVDHFEFLASEFATDMKAKVSRSGRRLRAWSAGCSSGEEAYTIAITLCESISDLRSWDAKILATDISTRVLAKAAEGNYSTERLKSVNPQLKAKYFDQTSDGRFQAKPILKNLIHVARLNLMESWPMQGPFDVIFCRNVMIYFDKLTQGKLIRRYWDLLDRGGVLLIGHSESLAGIEHDFEYLQPTVYRKT